MNMIDGFLYFRPFRTCLSLLLMDMINRNESHIQQQISNRAINVAFFLNRWTT